MLALDFQPSGRDGVDRLVRGFSPVGYIAMVMLPRPVPFGVSPDLTWLAISDRSRGGVWNLTSNQQVINARGFRGGYFGPDGVLYVDFRMACKE